MPSLALTAVEVVVAASGLGVVVTEALRTVPWDGRPWDWFIEVKSRDPEWLLFGAGLLFVVLPGIADQASAWVLLAVPFVYAWVWHYIRSKPAPRRAKPRFPPLRGPGPAS